MIGREIGRYRVLEKLGGGAMGVVYRAEDTVLRRSVALKFLPSGLTDSGERPSRFIREAQAASRIDHPNICIIHEIDRTDDDVWFIAMPWYEGRTLKHVIEDGPVPLRTCLDYAIQIAEGLACAHENGIVHRDVKPANLMVTDRDEVKIIDFGLASLQEQTRMTRDGAVLGTPSYMSPEQARGEAVQPASDTWSLGVVIYEMITGRLPFVAESDMAVLYRIQNDEPESLGGKPRSDLGRCQAVIDACLRKDPRDRYAGCADLARDLAVLRGDLFPDAPSSPSARTVTGSGPGRPAGAGRWRLGVAAVLVAAMLSLTLPGVRDWLHGLTGRFASPPVGVAVLPFRFPDADPEQVAMGEGLRNLLIEHLSRQDDSSDRIWVVPWDAILLHDVRTPAEAAGKLGADLSIDAVGRFGEESPIGPTLSLQLVIHDTADDGRETLAIIDDIANLRTWQRELPMRVATELDDALADRPPSSSTAVPAAFGSALIGSGRLYPSDGAADLEGAVTAFSAAVVADSSYAAALMGLGDALCRRSWTGAADPGPALELLAAAARLDPGPRPHYIHGRHLMQAGSVDAGATAYIQALERDPVHAPSLRGLADAYMALGRYAAADSVHRVAIAVRPNYPPAYEEAGYFSFTIEDFEGAVRYCSRLVDLTPYDQNAYDCLGAALFETGQLEEAEKMFERSLLIEPSAYAYANLGVLCYWDGRYADAIDACRSALDLEPGSYDVWRTLGETYWWATGHRDSALAAFAEAVRLAESELEAARLESPVLYVLRLSDLATIHVRTGRHDRAREILSDLEALDPRDAATLFNMATAWEELGDREAAWRRLIAAVEADLSLEKVERYPGLRNLRAEPRFMELQRRFEDGD